MFDLLCFVGFVCVFLLEKNTKIDEKFTFDMIIVLIIFSSIHIYKLLKTKLMLHMACRRPQQILAQMPCRSPSTRPLPELALMPLYADSSNQ